MLFSDQPCRKIIAALFSGCNPHCYPPFVVWLIHSDGNIMSLIPAADPTLIDELVVGNRILFHEKVVDGFGHISVRHDKDPTKFLLSRSCAPGLVTAEDILAHDFDGNPVDNRE